MTHTQWWLAAAAGAWFAVAPCPCAPSAAHAGPAPGTHAAAIARLSRREVRHIRRFAPLLEASLRLELRKAQARHRAGNLSAGPALDAVAQALHESLCDAANEVDASARTIERRFREAVEHGPPDAPVDASLLAGAARGSVERFRRGTTRTVGVLTRRLRRRGAALLRSVDRAGANGAAYRANLVAVAPSLAVPILTSPPTDPDSDVPRCPDPLRFTVAAAGGYDRRAKTGRVVVAGVAAPDEDSVSLLLTGTVCRSAVSLRADVPASAVEPDAPPGGLRRPGDVRRWFARFPEARADESPRGTTGLLQGRNARVDLASTLRSAPPVTIGIPSRALPYPDFEESADAPRPLTVDADPLEPTTGQLAGEEPPGRAHVYSFTLASPGSYEVRTLAPAKGPAADTVLRVFDTTGPEPAVLVGIHDDVDDADSHLLLAVAPIAVEGAPAVRTYLVRVSSWGPLGERYRIQIVRTGP